MPTLSLYESITPLLILGILTLVAIRPTYGYDNQASLSLEYWVDSACGSDTNAGSSKEYPFASFEPLSTLLPLSSASSVTIWLSPGVVSLQSISWPYSTSIKIAKCDGNCPICSLNDGSVTIEISSFNTSHWLPALHQLPQTLTEDTNELSQFELERVALAGTDFIYSGSIILISRANATFRSVEFYNFGINSQESMISFVNQSSISFEDSHWKNISCVGSKCQTLLVQSVYASSWFLASRIAKSTFSMTGCTFRDITSQTTPSRLFLIDSALKITFLNCYFSRIGTQPMDVMGSNGPMLGTVLACQNSVLLGNPMAILLRNVTITQSEGTLVWTLAHNARIEVENCHFTSNKGNIFSMTGLITDSLSSETTVSFHNTTFHANDMKTKLVSLNNLATLVISNCTFLDNTYTRIPYTIPIVSADVFKAVISQVMVAASQPRPQDKASGAGFELEASELEVDNVTFSDISLNTPGDLLKFWAVGRNDQESTRFLFTRLSFLRLSTALSEYGHRLLIFETVRGSGNLPQIVCQHVKFDGIIFSNSADSARNTLISASKLEKFSLKDLNINNVTFTLAANPIFYDSNRVPTSFITLNQISSVRLEQIQAYNSRGNIEVESCPKVLFSQFQFRYVTAPRIVSVIGFLEAYMSWMGFELTSGTAMHCSDGQKLTAADLSFQSQSKIGDGGGFHITKVAHIHLSRAKCLFNFVDATGGGLFAWDTRSLHIDDSSFSYNHGSSGAAIRAQSDSIIISNTGFYFNRATLDGGALSLITDHLILSGTHFEGNTASLGGAISFQYLPTTPYEKLIIEINTTLFHSNAASIHGGALFIPLTYQPLVSLAIHNTSAINNAADDKDKTHQLRPPPLANQFPSDRSGFGGFLCSPYPQSLLVKHSSFLSNSAITGGALFLSGQYLDPTILNSSLFHIAHSNFTQNFAHSNGGAISLRYIQNANQTFQSNFVYLNSASLGGFLSTYKALVSLLYSNIDSLQDGDKGQRSTSNQFIANEATAGGVLFSALNPLKTETRISGQWLQRNTAVIGAIALYTSVSSFSEQSSPCYPPNICLDNHASGYGVERASLHLKLKMDLPDQGTLHVFSFTTKLTGHLLDDFGQVYNDGLRSPIFMQLLDSQGESNPTFQNSLHRISNLNLLNSTAFNSLTQFDSEVTLSSLVTASYYENGNANVQFLLLNPAPINRNVTLELSISTISHYYQLNLTVGGCPVGMAMDEIYGCVPCPSGEFSLTNGVSCTACPIISHLSCVEGKILTSRGYWVISNPTNSSILPVLCPFPDRCLGSSNQCSTGRTGFLCSACQKGLSESWTSSCTNCQRPNWVLLCLVFLALWIITIVLHILISTSSGKATILVYFLQTSYLLISDVPISPFIQAILGKAPGSGSGPSKASKLINFFLCLFPMDIFQRQLLIASIPFIMALQLMITFFFYYLWSAVAQIWKMYKVRRVTKEASHLRTFSSQEGSGAVDSDSGSVERYYTEDTVRTEEEPLLTTEIDPEVNSEQDLSMEIYHDEIGQPTESDLSGRKDNLGSINNQDEDVFLLDSDPILDDRFAPLSQLSASEINEIHKETKFFHTSRLIRSMVYFWAQSFSSVLGFIMIFSDCRRIPGFLNHPFMAKSPSISCHSQVYKHWKLSLIATIPWILGVLVFISYRLFYGRWKGILNNHDVKYGILYEMFRPKFFFWKLFELFRRFVLALPVLPGRSVVEKSNLSAAIMVCLFVAQFLAKPYAQRLENNLALFTLAALILLALIPTWNPHGNPALLVAIPATILAVVVLVTLATTAAMLRMQLKRCRRRYNASSIDAR